MGNPATFFFGGVTEIFGGCKVQGIDGSWIAIEPAVCVELCGSMVMVAEWPPKLQADCTIIDESDADNQHEGFLGETETGGVPAAAAGVVIDGFAGTGKFTFEDDRDSRTWRAGHR